MKRIMGVLFLLLVFTLLSVPNTMLAEDNLLINSNAENGMQGWIDPDNIWYPTAAVTPKEGKFFFWPSKRGCESSYIYQDVDVSEYQEGTWVELTGWLANWDQSPHDEATLQLELLDSNGKILAQFSRSQRNPQWTQHSIQAQLVANTAVARVKLIAKRFVGNDNDAYFDDLCFSVIDGDCSQVFITGVKATAQNGDKLQLTANNGTTTDPENYVWSSSYNTIATVDKNGLVTFLGAATDEVAIYAEDIDSGFMGVYYINSKKNNESPVPDQVKNLKKGTTTANSIVLTWSSVENAKGYYIYQYNPTKKKWIIIETINDPEVNKATVKKLKTGATYKFKVVAFAKYGEETYQSKASKVLVAATSKR